MASEVQYVNCKELHNPAFTPRIISPQSDISPGCGSQLLQAPEVQGVELVSSSVSLLALADALPHVGSELENIQFQEEKGDIFLGPSKSQRKSSNDHHVEPPMSSVVLATPVESRLDQPSQMGNTIGGCSIALLPSSPSTLVSPTEVLHTPASLPEIAPERKNDFSRSGSHIIPSIPAVLAEHEATAHIPTESTPTQDEPSTSDRDDDVQFILSVTRKRRRKRPRLDILPGDQGKDTSVYASKDIPENISNDAGQSSNLRSHILGSNLTGAQSLPGPHLGMRNSPDHSSFPPAAQGSLHVKSISSATRILKTPKQATRKRKRNQEDSLAAASQTLGSTNINHGLISAKTPIPHRHLQFPQHTCRSGPISDMHHIAGTQLVNNSELAPGFRASCPPHGPVPLGQQSMTNVVQPNMSLLARAVTNAIPSSSASSISECLRRRPSLYTVPQWPAFPPSGSGMAIQAVSANFSRSAHQNPYVSGDFTSPGVSPVGPRIAGAGRLPPVGITSNGHSTLQEASQAHSIHQHTGPPTKASTSQNGLSKKSHPPNMLVDIAQTCQDSFPFALIAKRHNKPIQKVFDTFSAVIQLPLLRSAVDTRRSGKLGSLRMKEFRTMKRGLKEMSKGKHGAKGIRKAEKNGIDSA